MESLRLSATTFSLVIFLLLSVSCGHGNAEELCKSLDAAFRFRSALILISGEDFFELDADMKEISTGKVAERFKATAVAARKVDAAVVWSGDNTLYFFSGAKYYYYSNWFEATYGPYRNSRWSPFFDSGIDAAGKLGHVNYFFKDCEYVTYNEGGSSSYSPARPVHDLGLPCDLDAAWDQGDLLVVVKGAQSWVISADGSVRGPVDLDNEVTLTSASLCESGGKADWAGRISDELAYEEEHGCVVIDAALDYVGTVYLFNNDSYVRLSDEELKEDKVGRNYDWGGIGRGLEAAVGVPNAGKSYFFQGDQYFAYYGLAFGPFSSGSGWAPAFSDGVDAAGVRQGKVYFFQGCRIIRYEVKENKVGQLLDARDLGLPCDVNAAFAWDGGLYVIKGTSVWIWADDVTGPGPLSEVMELASWTVCE